MITFFTTAKPFIGSTGIQQRNSLQSLLHSVPNCEVLLIDPQEGAMECCKELGISAPLEVERSLEGTPLVDSMFGVVANRAVHPVSCYINCDILVTPVFGEVILRAHKQLLSDYLLVGQRIDMENAEPLDFSRDWLSRITELAKTGQIHRPLGSDYFAFKTGQFHRHNMPPLIVGRGSWDNWMIYESSRMGLQLVDLSADCLVMHQNHDYGHRKNSFQGYGTDPEAQFNKRFLPKRARGNHAYHLNRCQWKMQDGEIKRKPLVYPGEISQQEVAGGPAAALPGALDVPILLIPYCRPDTLRRVIDSMRLVRPKNLYICADAPPEDSADIVAKCELAKAELNRIDWPCTTRTHFAIKNLGAGRRIKSALDWVFSFEERAIILEDDVVGSEGFFRFCELLLEHLKDEHQVSSISGSAFFRGYTNNDCDYFFSRYQIGWGWATWRRAWEGLDHWIERWPEIKRTGALAPVFGSDFAAFKRWTQIFDNTYKGQYDTWDYQWVLHCFMQKRLAVHPRVNLVSNVGAGGAALHIKENHPLTGLKIDKMSIPPVHPAKIVRDAAVDDILQKCVLSGGIYKRDLTSLVSPLPKAKSFNRKQTSLFAILKGLKSLLKLQQARVALARGDTNAAAATLRSISNPGIFRHLYLPLKIQLLRATDKHQELAKLISSLNDEDRMDPLVAEQLSFSNRSVLAYSSELLIREPDLLPWFDYPVDTHGILPFKIGPMEFVDVMTCLRAYHDFFYTEICRFDLGESSPRIVDCSPGCGVSVRYFSRIYPQATLQIIQPDPYEFDVLQRNLNQLPVQNLTLSNAVLGDVSGETQLEQAATGLFPVRSWKLSSIALSGILETPVAILKLKAGGTLLATLASAQERLDRVDRILVEVKNSGGIDEEVSDLIAFLKRAGFRLSIQPSGFTGHRPFYKKRATASFGTPFYLVGIRPQFLPHQVEF